MDVSNIHCVVVGAGESGLAAAKLLVRRGAEVVLNDARDRASLGARANQAEESGIKLALGGHGPEVFEGARLIVLSPGVPPLSVVADAARQGAEVVSEIELAARFLVAPIVAITGTNGKSTVTTLVGDMLSQSGFPTFVGGNLGRALSDAVGTEADVAGGRMVVELSSFQLEAVATFRPRVAAVLNVTPDHLDRYPGLAEYAAAKARIFAAQTAEDHAILPAAEPTLVTVPHRVQRHLFGAPNGEVRVEEDRLIDDGSSLSLPVSELVLAGRHNQDNAAAAALIARLAGASPDAIARSLRTVQALPHRAQQVRELDGVVYVDDSKATNVGAAVAALDGLASKEHRAVLIAGGVDKGGSYAPLADRLRSIGRAVVLIGQAAPLIETALEGVVPTERATSMRDAVERARALARPGDLVILAPACSSYDMYKSYAHRGDDFAAAVRDLGGAR